MGGPKYSCVQAYIVQCGVMADPPFCANEWELGLLCCTRTLLGGRLSLRQVVQRCKDRLQVPRFRRHGGYIELEGGGGT